MNQAFWNCCGRNYLLSISKCRKCGKPKPNVGILETAKTKKPPHGNIDYDKVKDKHIGGNEKYYVSCMPK